MTEDEERELGRLVHGAENAAIENGWMPTKTVVLMDVVMPNGEREVAIAISEDLRKQDTLGLLHYAIAIENASVVRDAIADE